MRAILLGPFLGPKTSWKKWVSAFSFHPSDLLVGVDGGTLHWLEMGKRPAFAVGDWDSLGKNKRLLRDIPHVTLSTKKERSDLFYSILAAIQAGATEVLCLGVTGGRSDHHLSNLIDLSNFSAGRYGKLKSVQASGLDGDYIFLSDQVSQWKAQLQVGAIVSIFAMNGSARGVTLKGFRYPLKQAELLPSSLGLSNQVVGRTCEVRLRNGQLLVILPRHGSYE